MRTEPLLPGGQAGFAGRLAAMFNGAIFEAEFAGAEPGGARSPRAVGYDEESVEGTKEKTCKPTRNPCCHGDDDGVEGTKEKTCKPTRNPCCHGDDDNVEGTKEKTCKPTRNPCCHGDGDNVEGTKEKTCKPTRNPCCREEEERHAGPRADSLDLLTV